MIGTVAGTCSRRPFLMAGAVLTGVFVAAVCGYAGPSIHVAGPAAAAAASAWFMEESGP